MLQSERDTDRLGETCAAVSESREFNTVRHEKGEAVGQKDWVPVESSLNIYLCGTRLITVQATPDKMEELAVGFLLTEGLLKDISEYRSSSVDHKEATVRVEVSNESEVLSRLVERGEVVRTSGCGRGTSFAEYDKIRPVESEMRISPEVITRMAGRMLSSARLHRRCGGVHCSALVKKAEIVSMSEDIGRHNTVDKVVGECAMKGVDMSDSFLLTTGRASSEMVAKCARPGIAMIASISSPTDMAVEVAHALGVTVIGYVRGSRLTVYSHNERVEG